MLHVSDLQWENGVLMELAVWYCPRMLTILLAETVA